MDTKKLILKNAYKLFQEKSYQEVSIDDICNACNLTKPAFYYHFKAKSDLLIHYYDHVVEKMTLKISNKNDDYWKQFIDLFIQLIESSVAIGTDLVRQLFITNLKIDKGSFDFNKQFASMCVNLISKAQSSNQIRNKQDPKELFIASSFLFTGYEVFWAIKNDDKNTIQNVIASIEVIFDIQPELKKFDKCIFNSIVFPIK
ncbi:TetR/AcrR family transcriptional regulator [Companilactobacillus nodensis]|uniref:HTH tetR-type domain-containing protein n=1 Tax=Companilactobacillus nodensis DSM 19682 = JCM 14932 = NBRC 107160 TaxID=1423775 RepID=A0A0R1KFM9_9LACO|nr:TetR/AcrR family transcriptional regulator [Companilactobacillus nodensis]KRK78658.1 hypothetical protein FD03_GL002435 [Companilactobacillus nodensis DSM 19682 = JCM 14932 = NBRC 107160]